jgi:hypothetical protein
METRMKAPDIKDKFVIVFNRHTQETLFHKFNKRKADLFDRGNKFLLIIESHSYLSEIKDNVPIFVNKSSVKYPVLIFNEYSKAEKYCRGNGIEYGKSIISKFTIEHLLDHVGENQPIDPGDTYTPEVSYLLFDIYGNNYKYSIPSQGEVKFRSHNEALFYLIENNLIKTHSVKEIPNAG